MNVLARCKKVLNDRFAELYPRSAIDEKGYVDNYYSNFLELKGSIASRAVLNRIIHQFQSGDGGELKVQKDGRRKIEAIHSSAALAVNTFAPWLKEPETLSLAGISNFRSVEFEKKLPVTKSGMAANLDLMVSGFEGVVGVESKFLEPLSKTTSKQPFSAAYSYFRDKPNCEVWYEQVNKINNFPEKFRYLDAKQLTSHALGLVGSFGGAPVKLMYLFWEPMNWVEIREYAKHRQEIEAFIMEVRGASVSLEAISYPELWASWEKEQKAPWIRKHLSKIRKRYLVEL